MGSCCAPGRGESGSEPASAPAVGTGEPVRRWVPLAGGTFVMGCDDGPYPGDGEGPARRVRVDPFQLAATAVTNAEFAEFAEATGYRTDAERFGWSYVFAGLLPPDMPPTRAAVATPWWRVVEQAYWRHPDGPGSVATPGHPVVHVSHHDALAYCAWAGARLPTEAEWELAARGGLTGLPFPWGDELTPGGEHRMNVWQGTFPSHNTGADGYLGTAPADAFAPNAFGLYNMTGNVWEWCAGWFDTGRTRALRGGSYLCHESYCLRYRTSARMGNTPDSSSGNVGFRCARRSPQRDVPETPTDVAETPVCVAETPAGDAETPVCGVETPACGAEQRDAQGAPPEVALSYQILDTRQATLLNV